MKIHIDEDKCVAAGQCVAVAPDVFDQRDEDGIAILVDGDPTPDQDEDVRQAAAVCPAMAITLAD